MHFSELPHGRHQLSVTVKHEFVSITCAMNIVFNGWSWETYACVVEGRHLNIRHKPKHLSDLQAYVEGDDR